MNDPTTLLPCPFCGGVAAFGSCDEVDGSNAGAEFVSCAKCDATTALVFPCMDEVKGLLVERWNRRAASRGAETASTEVLNARDAIAAWSRPFTDREDEVKEAWRILDAYLNRGAEPAAGEAVAPEPPESWPAKPSGWSIESGKGWLSVRNDETQCGQDFYPDRDPLIFAFLSALSASPSGKDEARDAELDAKRLEWLMHRLSGKELRRIGISTLSGGPLWTRIAIDAAMAASPGRGTGEATT